MNELFLQCLDLGIWGFYIFGFCLLGISGFGDLQFFFGLIFGFCDLYGGFGILGFGDLYFLF